VYSSKEAGSSRCICATVKKLSRVLVRSYDEALAGCEINITQFAVVGCIARRAGEPLARVAEELEMDRTSLYRAIAPMVRDGWIETAAGRDARSLSAKVTQKGENVLAKAAAQWDAMQERLIGAFGAKAWTAMAGEIQRLVDCAEGAKIIDTGAGSGHPNGT